MKFTIRQFAVVALIIHCVDLADDKKLKSNEKECKKIPEISKMKLIECCSVPDLFRSETKDTCVSDCSDSDYKSNPWCCMARCMIEESGIGSNGTISKFKAKIFLKSNFNSIFLKKILDGAIDKCDHDVSTKDPQTEECDFPEYGEMLTCITQEVFKTCPNTVNDPVCLKIKNFLRKCPSKKDKLFTL